MAVLRITAGEKFTVACINAPKGLVVAKGITVQVNNLAEEPVVGPTEAGIAEPSEGTYTVTLTATEEAGTYFVVWKFGATTVKQELSIVPATFQSGSGELPGLAVPEGGPDLTDLKVLLPRARRKVEGPWGNPNGRAEIAENVLYQMIADACGEVVMLSGSFFHHQLLVKARDPVAGYPTEWQTDTELTEWEGAIISSQVALNYYYYLFRDMKISETVKNEGTEWTFALSANVLRNYLESLRDERDKALAGLRLNIPVLDRFASNIRVRDQATVAVLEWWDNVSPGLTGGGLPGGQEATSIPWFPGPEGGP